MKNGILSRILCGVLIVIVSAGLCACAGNTEKSTFEAMDTVMSLTVYGGRGSCAAIEARAGELDRALSAVDEDSEIYKLNHSGSAELSGETAGLIKRSLSLCAELGGSFDITVFPAVYEWGFVTGEYSVPDAERLRELAEKIGYRAVEISGDTATLSEGAMLDLGAVAKGYLADVSRGILEENSAEGAVLSFGGTVCLYGKKPDGSAFSVGIADPEAPASYYGILRLSGGVVATSGGYERYFEKDGKRYIHILDPATASPAKSGIASVTVITDEGAAADAYSTALFVMGADKAEKLYKERGGFEYVILTDSGRLYVTEGIADSFELCEGYDYDVEIVDK